MTWSDLKFAYFDLCVDNKWKGGGRGEKQRLFNNPCKSNGDQYGSHTDQYGSKKWLDPGCILRNEPVGFLDRLDMEEDI